MDSLTFLDFRPISLCNTIYKIISKIISGRIRGILSSYLSQEQYGFLIGRNILEAVAITQECLHSMHSKNIEATILKIYLKKAHDCLDWEFLRCLLIKIGLNNQCANWIMACVENVNYAIVINGIPSSFFSATRGLRRGCSLSPLLFILVMDSLSLHIKCVVREGICRPLSQLLT